MTNIVKYKGNKDVGIDLTDAEITTGVDFNGSGVTVAFEFADTEGAFDEALSNDTIGTTAEDGYIVVSVGGTQYKIPMWLDD